MMNYVRTFANSANNKNDHMITFILFEKRLSQLYVDNGCGFSHEYTVNCKFSIKKTVLSQIKKAFKIICLPILKAILKPVDK